MRSRSIFDLQGTSDNSPGSDLNFTPFIPGASPGQGGGNPSGGVPSSTPVAPILPDESVQAMAAVSGSGSGGAGSVVAETSSSGFTINLIFDAAAMAAPASFRAGIEQAASILSETITNKITVNLNIDYSGTGGGAAAGPDNGQFVNYSTVRADLIANAAPGDTSFNALPTGSTIQGQTSVAVWNAQLKLFGLLSPTSTTTDDGSATFATDINPNLLVGVALHELTHALGRVPYGSEPDIFDFYRFTSAGTRLFTDNIPATAAYFSLDGGNTKLADFGLYSDPSDFLNPENGALSAPYSNLTPNDPFNELYGNSTLQSLTTVDLKMLDALGFNTIGIIVPGSSSQALQGGSAVALLSGSPTINDPNSSTLSSATIKIANGSGSAVTGDELFVNGVQNGSLGNGVTTSWNATTDTLTLNGTASVAVYDTLLSEITFQDTGTDTSSGSHPARAVTWTINDGTNSYSSTSTIDVDRAPVAANNTGTDAAGATLTTTAATGVLANASDLDGDSLTVTAVGDSSHGAGIVGTSLGGAYGHLTLNANGSYSYIADNAAAIASAATGSHLQDIFNYTVSDGNGGTTSASLTITLDRAPVVTAANVALNTGQTTIAASSLFSATDPDGNTITTYAVENTGPGHFVLNGTAIEPNNQEIDLTAAQLAQLTYQGVAGSTADTVEVRVNDGTLWSNWTSFTVTPPPLVIQTDRSTALTEVSNTYYLYDNGSGPSLKFGGAPVTAGEFGTWTPIGAVQVAGGGYDVAWHDTSSGLYVVWNTDSNGNYLSNLLSSVPGNNFSLESLETTFNQDLNGDGTIGAPTVVIHNDGTTKFVEVGNNYFLNPASGGTGPELLYGGSVVTAGEFGTWTPIGAAQLAGGGYDIAWHDTSSGLYTVWGVSSGGAYQSSPIGTVAGNSAALENLEPLFNQDLNGDGTVGVPTVLIHNDGTTKFVEVGNNYFLNPASGGTGPELQFGGSAVTAGEFGTWTPIGAAQVAGGGYDIAWHDTSSGLYVVWDVASNGNYLSNLISSVPGNSVVLESLETTFNQDLNGDGTIGIYVAPGTTLQVTSPLPSAVGAATIGAGATLELGTADSASITFASSTGMLKLDSLTAFTGLIDNFTGNGSLSGSDQIDLKVINFNSVHDSYSNGILTITDGTNTTNLDFSGTYVLANFDFASDGSGGTIVYDPPVPAQTHSPSTASHTATWSDNFHFSSNTHGPNGNSAMSGAVATAGQGGFTFADSAASFASWVDAMPSSSTAFANIHAALADAHEDALGSVASDAAHWLAHHSGFHLL
jgi:serralysin